MEVKSLKQPKKWHIVFKGAIIRLITFQKKLWKPEDNDIWYLKDQMKKKTQTPANLKYYDLGKIFFETTDKDVFQRGFKKKQSWKN